MFPLTALAVGVVHLASTLSPRDLGISASEGATIAILLLLGAYLVALVTIAHVRTVQYSRVGRR
ncbi:hypothetical protein [Amycolatopsis palatopharyngis]|uniref:hypothetical protein n=1 Tax=Amycolatopsis palatopharyngis TaxID=187982 RepID=UPI000E232E75|nr:hypothetical protein [Amycolatopsis palatopharyngis]